VDPTSVVRPGTTTTPKHHARRWALTSGGKAGVDPETIDAVLAGLTDYFVDAARQPPLPGLPTLRDFQAAQGASTLGWLRRRLA